jgi:uncharacterized OB-fold protein
MHNPPAKLAFRSLRELGFEKFGLVSFVSQSNVSKFVDYLEQGKIFGTKCFQCGFLDFPPRAFCRRCLSDKWEWYSLNGDCRLITFTKVEAAPSAFKAEAPYLLGLAEFSEGPKAFAWVGKSLPGSQLKAGMRLDLKPYKLANGNFSYVLLNPRAT